MSQKEFKEFEDLLSRIFRKPTVQNYLNKQTMSRTNDDLIRKAEASQVYNQDRYLRDEMLETILSGNRKEVTVEFSEVNHWDSFSRVLEDIVNSGAVIEDFDFDFEKTETAVFDLTIEDYQDFIGRFKQTPSFNFQKQLR